MRISELDEEILKCLAKFFWLQDIHISCFTGENSGYIKGRLKALARAGLIQRKQLASQDPACNWITREGLQFIGDEGKTVREPSMTYYLHSKGVADICSYLTLPIFGEGKNERKYTLASIVTEREFLAVREMIETGTRSDGQPIRTPADKEIHAPDAYLKTGTGYIAIEFERTRKTTIQTVEKNMRSLCSRFYRQFWFYEGRPVEIRLDVLAKKFPRGTVIPFNMDKVLPKVYDYVENLPKVISSKSGVPRSSAAGDAEVIPLNKLPIIREVKVEETRLGHKHYVSLDK